MEGGDLPIHVSKPLQRSGVAAVPHSITKSELMVWESKETP